MADLTILEPMSTGDVIDRAVRLYRRNFTPLISIAAIPSVLGYIVSLLFWFGLSELENAGRVNAGAISFIILGAIGYPVWLFVLLVTIAGLSRIVGDHVMLEEPITFRGFVQSIRHRFKDIFLMGLLSLVALVAIYMAVSVVIFALFMVIGVVMAIIMAAGLPPMIVGILVGLVTVVGIAAGIFLVLVILVRVAFLPQVVMLEGQSAGNALTRAISLGKGNWHRLGAIVLFGYFVMLSLLAALMFPIMALLYMSGLVSEEFFSSNSWNAIYGACSQVSNLMVLPIWIISLTLLYFDSRVRKEAYDLELLAREIAPGFYWQPVAELAVAGFQTPVGATREREYTQTSPLGLAGFGRPPDLGPFPPSDGEPVVVPVPPVAQEGARAETQEDAQENAREESSTSEPGPQAEPRGPSESSVINPAQAPVILCAQCGAAIDADSRFCNICGATLSPSPR